MIQRSIKRVYTSRGLDSWVSNLGDTWEGQFSEEELKRGRNHYLNGSVRELELSESDAIVHALIDDAPAYIVIESDKDKQLSIRSSLDAPEWGRTIAVAGLYEIEELVADEASPLPFEFKDADLESEGEEEEDIDEITDEGPARLLRLKFKMQNEGLYFTPYWVDETNKETLLNTRNEILENTRERELIILLSSLAKRAGFLRIHDQESYVMNSLLKIPVFLHQHWDKWTSHFDLSTNPEIMNLKKGVQEADLKISAEQSIGNRAKLSLEFSINGNNLQLHDSRRLIRHNDSPIYIPSVGIVKASHENITNAKRLRDQIDQQWEGEIPNYMLFSLFEGKASKFIPSQRILEWKKSFTLETQNKKQLPSFLRNYQQEGVERLIKLCNLGCHPLLADEMGLGKTVQILTLLASDPIENKSNLVVCPASVIHVWKNEALRFYPNKTVKVLKSGSRLGEGDQKTIWLASYTQLRRNKDLLKHAEFGYAILDEAQFIKNPEAKVTQAAMAIKADRRIALTGTPIENRYRDIWTIFRFLMPGLLGTKEYFENSLMNASGPAFLRNQVRPFILRRTKSQVASDLPEKSEFELYCPMTEKQSSEYQQMINSASETFDNGLKDATGKKRMHFFALLTRLRQISCDPSLIEGSGSTPDQSGKLVVLNNRLQELANSGHKVVVFSQFTQLLSKAIDFCQRDNPAKFLTLTGRTRNREAVVDKFQNHEGPATLFVSLKAGGTGITLHSADYLFLLDPWWNPAAEAQAIDRVHRIGQKNPVFIYRLISRNTIEEHIQKLKASKREMFDHVVEESGNEQLIENLIQLIGENVKAIE